MKTFKQFISHSSTLDLSILQPGDVVVNIYLKTVSYVNGHKSLVPWANVNGVHGHLSPCNKQALHPSTTSAEVQLAVVYWI